MTICTNSTDFLAGPISMVAVNCEPLVSHPLNLLGSRVVPYRVIPYRVIPHFFMYTEYFCTQSPWLAES
jgi:hypothetical protein